MDEHKGDLTAYYKELYDCECEKNDQLVAQLEEAEKHIEELDTSWAGSRTALRGSFPSRCGA